MAHPTPANERTAYGYVRVSTELQVREGQSLEAQWTHIQAYAEMHGLDIRGFFSDDGISGARADNRPGLTETMDAVCREQAVLIVFSLSRLARSVGDAVALVRKLEQHHADLISLSEDLNTTTAAGRFTFHVFAALGQLERELIGERVRSVMALKKSRNERVGTVPFGFILGDDGSTLHPDPAEQKAIRRIQRYRANGLSYAAVAAKLNTARVPSKKGGRWHGPTVSQILKRLETLNRSS